MRISARKLLLVRHRGGRVGNIINVNGFCAEETLELKTPIIPGGEVPGKLLKIGNFIVPIWTRLGGDTVECKSRIATCTSQIVSNRGFEFFGNLMNYSPQIAKSVKFKCEFLDSFLSILGGFPRI